MSGGYEVDPAALRTAATGFTSASDSLETARGSLENALSAEGNCWGDDEAGQTFSTEYVPNSEGALEAFVSLVTGLAGLKTNLDASADTWESMDQESADSFRSGT
ncbi:MULTISPECIES: WXG100 family type VII secretion target [Actinoalloteichus]|uniref:WXG100 family type VII secretion target n=1 Tax=Actinoalloteichus fjordicus TaxID=1612552 RepID=A0AAC9LAP1_9PSEU|nr:MULTISPECIES: WXG100 family type VII secretion target [Actinoalloteichus]APU12925.1 hypothetical protein UA74_04230 [Actinoalloteichus fjordicus]APU18897.1 hypothetical protein UA75_04330 [Actinoalloteichus sp. GBA129-24]